MKAKDTVMDLDQWGEVVRWGGGSEKDMKFAYWQARLELKAQAEISFKIGKTAGVAESLRPAVKAIEESRKAGIKEAVDWVEGYDTSSCMDCSCAFAFRIDEWQAKLKEWGLVQENK